MQGVLAYGRLQRGRAYRAVRRHIHPLASTLHSLPLPFVSLYSTIVALELLQEMFGSAGSVRLGLGSAYLPVASRCHLGREDPNLFGPITECPQEGSCNVLPGGKGTDADFVLYVTSAEDTETCGSPAGFGDACIWDQETRRPMAGHINLCPSLLDAAPEAFGDQLVMAVHQILHALAFSADNFERFVDENGHLMGSSSFLREVREVCHPGRKGRGQAAWGGDHCFSLLKGTWRPQEHDPATGGRRQLLTTREVVRQARLHFGCESLSGVYMQGGHWHPAVLLGDLMDPFTARSSGVISHVTLALLKVPAPHVHPQPSQLHSLPAVVSPHIFPFPRQAKPLGLRQGGLLRSAIDVDPRGGLACCLQDSGWYEPIWEKAQPLPFGHGKGCQVGDGCSPGEQFCGPLHPEFTCSDDRGYVQQCTSGQVGTATMPLAALSATTRPQVRPKQDPLCTTALLLLASYILHHSAPPSSDLGMTLAFGPRHALCPHFFLPPSLPHKHASSRTSRPFWLAEGTGFCRAPPLAEERRCSGLAMPTTPTLSSHAKTPPST